MQYLWQHLQHLWEHLQLVQYLQHLPDLLPGLQLLQHVWQLLQHVQHLQYVRTDLQYLQHLRTDLQHVRHLRTDVYHDLYDHLHADLSDGRVADVSAVLCGPDDRSRDHPAYGWSERDGRSLCGEPDRGGCARGHHHDHRVLPAGCLAGMPDRRRLWDLRGPAGARLLLAALQYLQQLLQHLQQLL